VSIHDRDYMQDEEQGRPGAKGQRSAHVDRMLDQLDLSNLPPSPPKSAFRRVLDWFRGLLGQR
jgi:hypothetical protein